jgi:hypothetical protein
VIDILKKLNEGKDRCVLIGRNGLNQSFAGRKAKPFLTSDFDVVCPDLETAKECAEMLGQLGFVSNGATFADGKIGELDILISEPAYPEGILDGFYNVPSLRTLWEARKRKDGILVPEAETLIMNKLLYARENEGKDLQTIAIYFELEPSRLEPLIEKIKGHDVSEERQAMLYSLYASMGSRENARGVIEKALLSEVLGDAQIDGVI